jgi:hypothetical protein
VHNDGTKKTCASPHTGVTVIGGKRDFLVMEDDMVSYNIVLGDGGREIAEIWRDGSGQWPQKVTLKDAPKPPPQQQLLDVQNAEAIASLKPFVRHQTNAPDKHHCEELWVPGTASGKQFWEAYSYKFSKMATGACPKQYNFVNKKEVDYAGYTGVEYLEHGIHTKKKKMVEEASTPFVRSFMRGAAPPPSVHVAPTPLKCGGTADNVFTVTNNIAPSLKFRTCGKAVDPKTGWACNHGVAFKDCQRRVKQGETAKLEMDAGVKSILPITFTQEGAVDQVSACYMEMPQGGWQQLPAMKLDEGWWEKLQASC